MTDRPNCGPLSFVDAVDAVLDTPALLREYDRLNGTNLSQVDDRKPFERLIDEACGAPDPCSVSDEDLRKFFRFVRDYVWLPVNAKLAKGEP